MIKLKDILEFRSGKPSSGKPEKNDYIRDGKIFGKVVKFESWKGMKLAYIDPQSGMHQDYKGGSLVGYDMSKLKISKNRNVGKPIWIPK